MLELHNLRLLWGYLRANVLSSQTSTLPAIAIYLLSNLLSQSAYEACIRGNVR